MSFVLNNDTTLRGFLAHLQSIARKRVALVGEAADHPDATEETRGKLVTPDAIKDAWGIIRRDIGKILGVELVEYHELPRSETFTTQPIGGRDELRITMRVLKKRADKARMKDPSITLMKSWDLAAKESRPEE